MCIMGKTWIIVCLGTGGVYKVATYLISFFTFLGNYPFPFSFHSLPFLPFPSLPILSLSLPFSFTFPFFSPIPSILPSYLPFFPLPFPLPFSSSPIDFLPPPGGRRKSIGEEGKGRGKGRGKN